MPLRLVGSLLLAALLATSGCTRRATQLLVVIESDLPPERIACVVVTVRPLDGASAPVSEAFYPAPDLGDPDVSVPFSFGVTPPGGDATRRVEIDARAIDRTTCAAGLPLPLGVPFVSRRVRTGFLPEQTLRLPIFLANDCYGVVCGADETCDYGACVAVPDIDPGTLVLTEAGAELLDAGAIDAAIEAVPDSGMDAAVVVDAGVDAGTDVGVDAFAPFNATRPSPAARATSIETDDPHAVLYPVGVSQPAHLLVAGITARGVALGGLSIPASSWPDAGPPRDAALTDAFELDADLDANVVPEDADRDGGTDAGFDGGAAPPPVFFLAKLEAATRAAEWATTFATEGPPYPVVRRMVRLADGSYLACGTAAAPFYVQGVRRSGSSSRWMFLLRLTSAGVPDAFATMHAPDASAEVWCQDLDVSATGILVAARVWGATALRTGGSDLVRRGTLDALSQNHLLARVRSDAAGLAIDTPVVLGYAPLTGAQTVLGLDGTATFARALPSGGWIIAVDADALDTTGATTPSGAAIPRIARLDGSLAPVWSTIPITSALGAGGGPMQPTLRALAVEDATVWLAITMQLEGDTSGTITFGDLDPITATRDATHLLRVEPGTGRVVSAVELPEGIDAGADDRGGADSARGDLLTGHALALGAGHALLATSAADGDHVGPLTLTVTPTAMMSEETADPVLAIVNTSGAGVAAWQWDFEPVMGRTARDWRLTHVEHVQAGWVAVAGYVEDQAAVSWRRELSFFEILPAR